MAVVTSGAEIAMQAVLELRPLGPVTQDELEAATMEVEDVLASHALDLTEGASASANLSTGSIEIDLLITGASAGELHQKVALVVTQLDGHCSINIAPLGERVEIPRMAIASSSTHVLPLAEVACG